MQKHVIEAEGVLDKNETMNAERGLYVDSHSSVRLDIEYHDEEAVEIFHTLPDDVLPPLPNGYEWAENLGCYSLIKSDGFPDATFKLILYGPENDKINFLFQVDDTTTYSFAHTKKGKQPKRKYPMSNKSYNVSGFDYSKAKYRNHVRGHLIDHQDTMEVGQKEIWSTYDLRNYVPEPPDYEWGLGIRNQDVGVLRKSGERAYAQYSIYPHVPLKTSNGTCVPEQVLFKTFSLSAGQYKADHVFHVKWSENMRRPRGTKVLEHANKTFVTGLEATPIIDTYSPEKTDRALRRISRNQAKNAINIKEGGIFSRYPGFSEMSPRTSAADKEMGRSNRKLKAGIVTDREGMKSTSVAYVKRSLFYGEKLRDQDVDKIFDKGTLAQGKKFLREKQNDEDWNPNDLDSLMDHLGSFSFP